MNRPNRTTAELIALINQHHIEWWPRDFSLTVDRSAEHDWIAIVDPHSLKIDESRKTAFSRSLGQVVAELRLRNAWAGH